MRWYCACPQPHSPQPARTWRTSGAQIAQILLVNHRERLQMLVREKRWFWIASIVERAELHIAIGAGFVGVLVMWALRGGATSAMPGRAAALPASAPNWRRAESNLERAPQVGVNLESTSASWSQPGVALKTWSQHLTPGASSLQLRGVANHANHPNHPNQRGKSPESEGQRV